MGSKKSSIRKPKKEYTKPSLKLSEPLVDITFASPATMPATTPVATTPATTPTTTVPTTGAGTITANGSDPGTFLGTGKPVDDEEVTGTVLPGTGGAPGTVL